MQHLLSVVATTILNLGISLVIVCIARPIAKQAVVDIYQIMQLWKNNIKF